MAKKSATHTNTTPKPNEPLGPPELSPSASRKVPQLVSSTRSTRVEPVAPEEPQSFEEIWAAESEEPAKEPAAKLDPVVRAYGEPVRERQAPEQLNEHVEDPGDPDGVFREQQRRKYSQADETVDAPAAKRKKRHPFLKFLLIVALLAAATAGVFWYGSYKAAQNDKTTQPNTPVTVPKKTTPAVMTKQYNSSNFSLSLNYPSTWMLNDTTSKLTIITPDTQVALADGSSKAVRVVFTIQPKQSSIVNYPASGAVAALASDKLAYTKPNLNQRAQTYLSYLGYSDQNGLDALFVTGDNGYQQGQAVPQNNLITAGPLISVGFVTCTDATCADGTTTAQTLLASKWQSTQTSKDVANIVKSIELD